MLASLEEIKQWWALNVNVQPIWRIEDLPEVRFKEILISLNLAYEIRRDVLALGKPETTLSILIHTYYWEIVSCVLKPYSPYAITGLSAIHYYLGDRSIPNKLEIFTKSSSISINIEEISILTIEKNSAFYESPNFENNLKKIKTNKNYLLTIESPESILIRLRPQHFRDYPQIISSFLKAIEFEKETLISLIFQKSKPITYLRLANLFEQVGKQAEAQLLRTSLKSMTSYNISGKTQIIKYSLPTILACPKQLSDPVYITRFRDQIKFYKDQIISNLDKLKIPHWNLKEIQEYAEKTKKYDTYHSSTIEGYRVTQEEIQMLIDGREISSIGKNREETERKMALKGYLEAHKFVTKMIEKDFKNRNLLNESIIREIYAHLFLPSVESELIDKTQLTQYRNDAVFIRNSRYVPPAYQKIDNLMGCLVEEINEIENDNKTKAIIAHYGFVTIHPYFDGNGRVARLLMNYILCCGGIPWITIRIEDREKYFHALEIAQCDDNIKPFVELMEQYLKESLLLK